MKKIVIYMFLFCTISFWGITMKSYADIPYCGSYETCEYLGIHYGEWSSWSPEPSNHIASRTRIVSDRFKCWTQHRSWSYYYEQCIDTTISNLRSEYRNQRTETQTIPLDPAIKLYQRENGIKEIANNSVINFEQRIIQVEMPSVIKTFQIRNAGYYDLNISSIYISGADAFEIIEITELKPLAYNDTIEFKVKFNTDETSQKSAIIDIWSNALNNYSFTFTVNGQAVFDTILDRIHSDLNNDEYMDTLILDKNKDTGHSSLFACINNGNGYTLNPNYTIESLYISGSPGSLNGTVADLDNDGDMDVLVKWTLLSTGQSHLYSFMNNGNGFEFSQNSNYHIYSSYLSGGAGSVDGTLADLDSDGDMDVLVKWTLLSTGQSHLYSFMNNGNGFELSQNSNYHIYSSYLSGGAGSVDGTLADLDSDGDMDVLVKWTLLSTGQSHLYSFMNNGNGFELSKNPEYHIYSSYLSGGSGTVDGTLADLDNDGDMDVLVKWTLLSTGQSHLYSFMNNDNGFELSKNPKYHIYSSYLSGSAGSVDGTLINFDNDSDMDILVKWTLLSTGQSHLYSFENTNSGYKYDSNSNYHIYSSTIDDF